MASIPDARAYDSVEPAFHSCAEFNTCSQLVNRSGEIVSCAVERIGGYGTNGGMTELTDILFGPGDDNQFVFELAPADYDVLRIVDRPERRNCAATVYFTLITQRGLQPQLWDRFPPLYGSDAYNMTVTSPQCRRRITQVMEQDTSYWNDMCEMIKGYYEHGFREFERLGFHFSSPDGDGREAVFTPTLKVASFFLGYTSERQLVAIQGRWL